MIECRLGRQLRHFHPKPFTLHPKINPNIAKPVGNYADLRR